MNEPLNAVVVGAGALGKHHARVYGYNEKTRLIAVVDVDGEARDRAANEWNCQGASSLEEVAGRIDLASVVAPTVNHYAIASWLIERGIPALVEKPIAISVEEGEKLAALARAKGVLLQVGHIERFNPGVLALGERLTNPLFIESHRLGPPAPRVKDIGVVLDLMIHDLDLILALVKSEIVSVDAVGTPIISTQEDIANARLRFASGCVANVTVSRVTPERQRKIRFFQKDAYLSLDYLKPDLQIYRKETREDGIVTIRHEQPVLSQHEPLAAEIDSFIECVRQGKEPVVTGEDGVRALRLAQQIAEQARAATERLIGNGI
ncbi:MAG: Gfo/Idh/MocA family oxidoreductase [Candidatus Omnitrophota bacterium]